MSVQNKQLWLSVSFFLLMDIVAWLVINGHIDISSIVNIVNVDEVVTSRYIFLSERLAMRHGVDPSVVRHLMAIMLVLSSVIEMLISIKFGKYHKDVFAIINIIGVVQVYAVFVGDVLGGVGDVKIYMSSIYVYPVIFSCIGSMVGGVVLYFRRGDA